MRFRNLLISMLAGSGLAIGGGLVYRRQKKRLAELRASREKMCRIVALALETLAARSGGRKVSASEAYFFIWMVERVASRQGIEFPSFNFTVRNGMLASPKLTYILRRLLKKGCLRLEGNYLAPDRLEKSTSREGLEAVAMIVEEAAAQWTRDFPEEPLVRFGRLFK